MPSVRWSATNTAPTATLRLLRRRQEVAAGTGVNETRPGPWQAVPEDPAVDETHDSEE